VHLGFKVNKPKKEQAGAVHRARLLLFGLIYQKLKPILLLKFLDETGIYMIHFYCNLSLRKKEVYMFIKISALVRMQDARVRLWGNG
jgi:uncharacterized protein YbcI